MRYFIYSYEHAAWWRPASLGYTTQPHEAGTYPAEAVAEICAGDRRGDEFPVRENDRFQIQYLTDELPRNRR